MITHFKLILLIIKLYTVNSATEFARYKLHQSQGQAIQDLSGNGYHLVNGDSLSSDSKDGDFTARGGYFENGDYLTLPPNDIAQNSIPWGYDLSFQIWVYM